MLDEALIKETHSRRVETIDRSKRIPIVSRDLFPPSSPNPLGSPSGNDSRLLFPLFRFDKSKPETIISVISSGIDRGRQREREREVTIYALWISPFATKDEIPWLRDVVDTMLDTEIPPRRFAYYYGYISFARCDYCRIDWTRSVLLEILNNGNNCF